MPLYSAVTAEMLLTWRRALSQGLHILQLQLNSEKLELEKRESEQEGIVSKLQKKVTGFCGASHAAAGAAGSALQWCACSVLLVGSAACEQHLHSMT